MKKAGYSLMQIAVYLIILGGIGDILYSFSVESLIPAHLEYLDLPEDQVPPALRNLDLAFIRAIGGLLIAIGIGSLVLLQIGVKYNSRLALWGMLLMLTIGEGNNALQMKLIDSPFYMAPLFFLGLMWAGAILWLCATKNSN